MNTIEKSMKQTDEVIAIAQDAQDLLAKAIAQRDELRAAMEMIAKGYAGIAGNAQGLSGTDCAEIARAALAKVPK